MGLTPATPARASRRSFRLRARYRYATPSSLTTWVTSSPYTITGATGSPASCPTRTASSDSTNRGAPPGPNVSTICTTSLRPREISPPAALISSHAWEEWRLPRASLPRLGRSEEHTSELQSHSELVCRLLLEKK